MIRLEPAAASWHARLGARVVVMMFLALLPIGLIAIGQTQSVTQKNRQNAELALLVSTEQAALVERLAIQRAFGIAQGLSAVVPQLLDDPQRCSSYLRALAEQHVRISLVGFIPIDGVMACSSADRVVDFSNNPQLAEALADPKPRVTTNTTPAVSATPVVIVSEPARDSAGNVLGFMSVSIPHAALRADVEKQSPETLSELITFNRQGEVLTSNKSLDDVQSRLPANRSLTTLVGKPQSAFTQKDASGRTKIFAVVPIQSAQVYALGIWDPSAGVARSVDVPISASLFPILMMLASLSVALFAVHRLVTRHIRAIRRNMANFAHDRTLPGGAGLADAPEEMRDIHRSFENMAREILQDEAELEDAVREKTVLIKEIHHRVKNNLQLISSIINMQIRSVSAPESKQTLRRIQDRVLSLATIHRDLYATQSSGRVNVGELIKDVVNKSLDIGTGDAARVKVETNIDSIRLYPDQAVPMSLLAAEAMTNALKHLDPQSTEAWVKVVFREMADERILFEVSNSINHDADTDSTGMGAQLMQAFALQLGGDLKHVDGDDHYTLRLRFSIQDFSDHSPDHNER